MERLSIDQMSLVSVIAKEIGKQHQDKLVADERLFNIAIEAANLCKNKLDGMQVETMPAAVE